MSTDHQDRRGGDRIGGRTKVWPKDPGLKDDNENRPTGGDDGSTHLEANKYSWGQGFYESLARHERYLAALMELRSGMRVLEVGCGIGGSAREIATFSDAYVVGVNNNEAQVQSARWNTERAGLEGQVEFVKGDIMNLVEQFGENSFDAVYAIESTCHAPSWEAIYGQIKKVLKPGGVFGVYEWCMTDAWDPSNPEHQELAYQLEVGNHALRFGDDIPKMRPLKDSRRHALPWYYPLRGDDLKARMPWQLLTTLSTSWIAKFVIQSLRLLETIRLVPKGTWEMCHTLRVTGDALVRGVQMKLFTPMYLVIARKPLEE